MMWIYDVVPAIALLVAAVCLFLGFGRSFRNLSVGQRLSLVLVWLTVFFFAVSFVVSFASSQSLYLLSDSLFDVGILGIFVAGILSIVSFRKGFKSFGGRQKTGLIALWITFIYSVLLMILILIFAVFITGVNRMF